jgi:hypothetical protein
MKLGDLTDDMIPQIFFAGDFEIRRGHFELIKLNTCRASTRMMIKKLNRLTLSDNSSEQFSGNLNDPASPQQKLNRAHFSVNRT